MQLLRPPHVKPWSMLCYNLPEGRPLTWEWPKWAMWAQTLSESTQGNPLKAEWTLFFLVQTKMSWRSLLTSQYSR